MVLSAASAQLRRGGCLTKEWNQLIMLKTLNRSEEGQALVEYALILSLISVVAIGALTLIGTNVNSILNTVAAAL
jgi:pilus assembly protein Flp/PilA